MQIEVMVLVNQSDGEYEAAMLTDEGDSTGQVVTVRMEGESIERGPGEVWEVDASTSELGEGGQDLLDRAMAAGFRVRTKGK